MSEKAEPTRRRVLFVHTVPTLVEAFDRLSASLLPGVEVFHILDEPLLERVRRRGSLADQDAERLMTHAGLAAEIQAGAMLVTCSTVSPAVERMRERAPIPVLKIDEAMLTAAVTQAGVIGVLATSSTTLEPTRAMILAKAAKLRKEVACEAVLVEEAFSALQAGALDRHDRLIHEAVQKLAPRVELIVFAQASMARALEGIPERERRVPILSSPHLALAQIKGLVLDSEI